MNITFTHRNPLNQHQIHPRFPAREPGVLVSQQRLRFRGELATEEAKRDLVPEHKWWHILDEDPDPYMGEPPQFLLEAAGCDREEFLNRMDALAEKIRTALFTDDHVAFNIKSNLKPDFARILKETDWPFPVEYIKSGFIGSVFKVTIGNYQCAFKLASMNWLALAVRSFIYTNHLVTSNVPLFYGANLSIREDESTNKIVNTSWMLTEFIDSTCKWKKRPGKTLKEHGLAIVDAWRWDNKVHGFYVDLDMLYRRGDSWWKQNLLEITQLIAGIFRRRPQ